VKDEVILTVSDVSTRKTA